MIKHFLANVTLLSGFLLLLALPLGTFGLLRPPTGGGGGAVLSAKSVDYDGQLLFGRSYKPLLLQEITATVFPSQKAVYEDVLTITNNTTLPKTYVLDVLKDSAEQGVISVWAFKNGGRSIKLAPGEGSSASLTITAGAGVSSKASFLVAVN